MTYEETLNKLLEIEDRENLFELCFDGTEIPIWAHMRFPVFATCMYAEKERFTNGENAKGGGKKALLLRMLKTVPVFQRIKHKDMIFIGSDRGNTTKKNGKWFNYYHDYYAELLGDRVAVVESAFGGENHRPRYIKNTYTTMWFSALSRFLALGTKSADPAARERDLKHIDCLISRLKDCFGPIVENDKLFEVLRRGAYGQAGRMKRYLEQYDVLFRYAGTKALFVNAGCYMGSAPIIYAAKKNGMTVCELQHGDIARDHPTYHWGSDAMKSDTLRKIIPDYLLLYGQYFEKNIRLPLKTKVVGNPVYTERMSDWMKKGRIPKQMEYSKTVLITCEGTYIPYYIDAIRYLKQEMDGFENCLFMVKPHPKDIGKEDVYDYAYLREQPNVRLITGGSIYDCFGAADIFVMTPSTAVYEAVGFQKPIFALDDALARERIPQEIGERFSDYAELKNILLCEDPCGGNSRLNIDEIFDPNWSENFKGFVQSIQIEC